MKGRYGGCGDLRNMAQASDIDVYDALTGEFKRKEECSGRVYGCLPPEASDSPVGKEGKRALVSRGEVLT